VLLQLQFVVLYTQTVNVKTFVVIYESDGCTTVTVSQKLLGDFFATGYTSARYTLEVELHDHLNRLSEEEAEAGFVQPQFPVIIYCSYSCNFALGLQQPAGLMTYNTDASCCQ